MQLTCNLRKLRRDRELTQQQLSDKTGIHVMQISEYERNKVYMNIQTAYQIADALGCRVDSLYKKLK